MSPKTKTKLEPVDEYLLNKLLSPNKGKGKEEKEEKKGERPYRSVQNFMITTNQVNSVVSGCYPNFTISLLPK